MKKHLVSLGFVNLLLCSTVHADTQSEITSILVESSSDLNRTVDKNNKTAVVDNKDSGTTNKRKPESDANNTKDANKKSKKNNETVVVDNDSNATDSKKSGSDDDKNSETVVDADESGAKDSKELASNDKKIKDTNKQSKKTVVVDNDSSATDSKESGSDDDKTEVDNNTGIEHKTDSDSDKSKTYLEQPGLYFCNNSPKLYWEVNRFNFAMAGHELSDNGIDNCESRSKIVKESSAELLKGDANTEPKVSILKSLCDSDRKTINTLFDLFKDHKHIVTLQSCRDVDDASTVMETCAHNPQQTLQIFTVTGIANLERNRASQTTTENSENTDKNDNALKFPFAELKKLSDKGTKITAYDCYQASELIQRYDDAFKSKKENKGRGDPS